MDEWSEKKRGGCQGDEEINEMTMTTSACVSSMFVQFNPFESFVEPGFWWKLTENKVNVYKLDDTSKSMRAYYSNANNPGLPCRLTVDFAALDTFNTTPANCFVSHGILHLANTIEAFRNFDKKDLLRQVGISIWSDIRSGRVFDDVSLLSRFILLCYIDAKKYHYYYWFGHPALCFPDEIRLSSTTASLNRIQKLSEAYNSDEIEVLQRICTEFSREDATGYFLLEETEKALFHRQSLSKIKDAKSDASKLILGFCDPSTNEAALGWPARNLLALWSYYRPETTQVRLLCWRQRYHKGKVECEHSLLAWISFAVRDTEDDSGDNDVKVVGWEKNEKGQSGPRFVDLSSSMQPEKLAENAVSLNLQLMRWRLVPDLDLDSLSRTSCLIFGAGTLGCNLARCCLAWGIKKITFVDCGKVSYSNPVRQSLFTFQDCLNGGQPKAEAAAAGLKRIFPNVDATGVQLTIPMPGHMVTIDEMLDVMKTVAEIEELVKAHDVLFLLLDTREGRWLPTLLSALHSKITFSVALGFDSYVVVRHGVGFGETAEHLTASYSSATNKLISGDRLGCYFCTDVVAPTNSTHDRSLDQQCTVTRPGLSMIASALAVELAVSILQHPQRGLAPAHMFSNENAKRSEDEDHVDTNAASDSCLGYVAHQIRGYASTFEQMTATAQRFPSCTACSEIVVNEYRKRGFEFLRAVFNDPMELERVTGLDALKRNTDTAEIIFLSDYESD